jgi:hypothetical protein
MTIGEDLGVLLFTGNAGQVVVKIVFGVHIQTRAVHLTQTPKGPPMLVGVTGRGRC